MAIRPLAISPRSWLSTRGRCTAACAFSLVTASALVAPQPALAAVSIDIPAGPLTQSLRGLADQTGVSIGYAGALPGIKAKPVHGARSASEALDQMLAGSGLHARATGQSSFRIERDAKLGKRPTIAAPRSEETEVTQIIVTALKRSAPLLSLPATIDIVRPDEMANANGIGGSDALDRELPSLSASDLGAGRNRLFLRGIGDGPLGGFNQGSVAILLDEARLTYDAPDPDWALVDVDRVEVLEGPQGPLYGTGAIGGIVKVMTRQPDLAATSLSASGGLALTRDGDLTNSQSLIVNLPIAGTGAARAVAYRVDRAGWIDNVGGKGDANSERLTGGRFGLKFVPGKWTIDLAAAIQSRSADDSQYVDGDFGPLKRAARLGEARDLDASVAMLTVTGPVAGLELTSVTSLSKQEAVASYDATPLADLLGTSGETKVTDDRRYTVFDQEVRLRQPGPQSFDWIVGASLIKASTDADVSAEDATSQVEQLSFRRSVTEAALFGEASYKVSPKLTIGAGGRIFATDIKDEGRYGGDETLEGKSAVRGAVSAALNWQATPDAAFFVRGSTAYRPGGINPQPEATQSAYQADELASIEFGGRAKIDGALTIAASAFVTQWQHVQADELLASGLVATLNAGDAVNFGLEGKLSWLPAASTRLDLGFLVQSSKLQNEEPGSQVDDTRLPIVPQAAARFKVVQGFRIAGWQGRAAAGVDYVGATHLSFDPTLDRRTPGHVAFDASASLAKDGWQIGIAADNLTNSTADTFAFGNPYRVRGEAQRTPEHPRTIGLTLSRNF